MARLLARGLSAVLIALLVLVCALLAWTLHPQSLGTTLQVLPNLVPAARGLSVEQATGSLFKGGKIGRLHWQADGLNLDIHDLHIAYDLRDLLQRRLELSTARAAEVHINDQSPAKPDRKPPASLQLPISVLLSARVDRLFVQGQQQPALEDVQVHYSFDGLVHQLDQGQFKLASGRYQVQAQVQAQAPMQLRAELSGELQAPSIGKRKGQTLEAIASLSGTLAQVDSTLQLRGQVQAKATRRQGVNADTTLFLQATIQPWQNQALANAQAQWARLDLAPFWPGSPHTQLSGQLQVQPMGQRWAAHINIDNGLVGPLDQQRLPLQSLQARLSYEQQTWVVQALEANSGAGRLSGLGRLVDGRWQVSAQLQRLEPQSIDTRWQGGAISGTLQAHQQGKRLQFETDLHAANWSATSTAQAWPVHLQALQSKGQWSGSELTLERLQLRSMQASVQGNGRYNTAHHEAELNLELQAPGLQASIQGGLTAQNGQGQLAIQVEDARRSTQWLGQWPALKSWLQAGSWQGQAALQGQWQGGWKDYRSSLNFDLALQAPFLQWTAAQAASSSAWAVRDLQTHISGTPGNVRLSSDSRLEMGAQRLQWHSQARAQIDFPNAELAIDDLRLGWQASALTQAWTAQLKTTGTLSPTGVLLRWQESASSRELQISPGRIDITGPLPGRSTVQWTPSRWEQVSDQPAQWHSQGEFKDLPASWMDALSPKPMAELGLSSDLILQGLWQIRQSEQLSVHARIERARGDLRLNTGDLQQPVLPAELREASLSLDLNNEALAANVRWDSSRAGKALIAFSTTLEPSSGTWYWPDTAPVAASIQLQSPPAQAWTVLTPPGWRLKGVVDANLRLAGTRAQPAWTGQVSARDLALRSLVNGLDFDRGTLQATVSGQELTIEHASLQGAGSAGGSLQLGGTLAWITDSRLPKLLDHVRANLAAELQSFRVSVRPDRRLSASGKVQASLQRSQWSLNGALKADHALITLPDDSAPTLGDDVVVRQVGNSQQASLFKTSTAPGSAPMVFKLKVSLDPGDDFQIRGRGLQGRLAGQLLLQSTGPGTTRLTGTLHTADSTYQAYGQRLNIEQGRLLFSGSMDNPTLDILAIRPQITQRVGVQISGTALAPVVRLYADPDLPDVEKLSWLLTGRAASAGGAEAALLQQAAMTLLSGRNNTSGKTLAQNFGLDVLSLQSKSTTSTNPNTNSAAPDANAASITLGKRLSNDVYVAYEHSLSGTVNAFSIFYELSQRFTLRAQTGDQTALDLIFTLRYD